MLTRSYFKVFKSGREDNPLNALFVISISHPAAKVIVDNYILRSGYVTKEISFAEMLDFPAKMYSVFRIGSIVVDVAHSSSLRYSSVFLKFFREHLFSCTHV